MSDIRTWLGNHRWTVAVCAAPVAAAVSAAVNALFGDSVTDSIESGVGTTILVVFIVYGEWHAVDDERRTGRTTALRTRWLLRVPPGRLAVELVVLAAAIAALTFPIAVVTHRGLIGALGSWVILGVLMYAFMYRRGRLRASPATT